MEQVLVSQTKNYLVLKIPLQAVKRRRVLIGDPERAAVLEGLRAIEEGRISKPFNNTKEAVACLRTSVVPLPQNDTLDTFRNSKKGKKDFFYSY